MSYEPVEIVARVRLAMNERGRDPDWYLATDEAAEDTAEWRSALVAELERLAQTFDDNFKANGLPYERSNHRVALTYRHAARLVRGES